MTSTTKASPKGWNWAGGHDERMRKLLDTGFLSDASLLVGPEEKVIRVHRLILEAGSPVFHQMFKTAVNNELTIADVDSDIFLLFLKHLYVGNGGGEADLDETKAMELLKLGSHFQVQELMDTCATFVEKSLRDETAVQILQKAMDCGHKTLIQTALSYCSLNGWKIVELDQFLELRQECLYEILKRDDLRVRGELQLYQAVIRWGEAECGRKNLEAGDGGNLRLVLENLLGLIRFPVMDQTSFSRNVARRDILSKEEVVSILLSFIDPTDQQYDLESAIPPGRFNSTSRSYYAESNSIQPHATPTVTEPIIPNPTLNHRIVAYRYDQSKEQNWELTSYRQPMEILRFKVNNTVLLEGFKCQYCRNDSWKDKWAEFMVHFSVKNDGDMGVVSGVNPLLPNWEIKLETAVEIVAGIWYSLTVQFSHRNQPDKILGLFGNGCDIGTGYLGSYSTPGSLTTTGGGHLNVEFGRKTGDRFPLNEGFIDSLTFTLCS